MLPAFPYQAVPRFGHVAIDYNQKVYLWGGHTQKLPYSTNTAKVVPSVDVFDHLTGTWKKEMCTGQPPPHLDGCAYIKDGDMLYVFGGWNGDLFYNCLHQLNLWRLEWKDVKLSKGGCIPSRKARAGMAKCGENLILFGGFGAIADPSTSQQKSAHEIEGLTNELHLFSIPNSVWSRQETSHTPPPCASFSFVHTGQGRIIKFGGRQPDGCTNAVHVLDLLTWDWTKVRSTERSPAARGGHSTCYLADSLMITGGRGNDMHVYCDAWTLDVTSMEWTQPQVNFSEVNLRRCCHTATVINGASNGTLVVIFGGLPKWKETGVLPAIANAAVVDVGQPDHWTLVSNNGRKAHHHHHHHHHHNLSRARSTDLVSLEETTQESQEGSHESTVRETEEIGEATPPITSDERLQRVANQFKQRKRRRHSHPAKQGIVPPRRRSVPHDLIGRPWMVGKEEVQMTGDLLWRDGEEGDSVQVAIFRGLRVAAHCINSSKNCAQAMKDMDTYVQMHHPNIVQLIGFTISNGLVVLRELMPTTLAAALVIPGGLARPQVLEVGLDVARALNYLHLMKPHPLVHGAVESVNIFLEPIQVNSWRAKLSCKPSVQTRHTEPHANNQTSTADHTESGQDLQKLLRSPSSDIYSFGQVLLEMTDERNLAVKGLGTSEHGDRARWPEVEEVAKRCMSPSPQSQPNMATVIVSLSTVAK